MGEVPLYLKTSDHFAVLCGRDSEGDLTLGPESTGVPRS